MTNRNDWKTSITVFLNAFNEERVKDLQKNDIHFMELTGCGLDEYKNFSSNSISIFQLAKDHKVTIQSIHLPFYPWEEMDPASTIKAYRDTFIEKESELLKIAANRGVKIAVAHPSAEPYKDELREENLKAVIDSFAKLNDVAKKAGIILAVENLPRTCMCRDCSEIVKIYNAIPDIHFCFDSNHSLIDDNVDIIKTMGERIVATHISDYEFYDEMHLFPGEGKNNWQQIMQALEEVNYSGNWNYEIRDCSDIPAKRFKDNHMDLLSGKIK